MPSLPVPPRPLPDLWFGCVWEDCTNRAVWERRRGKPMLRLHCDRHRILNARLNKIRRCAHTVYAIPKGKHIRLVRVSETKRRPYHVVRYEQLLGRPLNGEEFVTFRNGNDHDLSLRNLHLISRSWYRQRVAYGRGKREAGLYG